MAVKNENRGFGKEERDLLIRLDQRMAGVEVAINKIDSGVTGRLLNLESNSVSSVEFDSLETKVDAEIARNADFRSRVATWGSAGLLFLGVAEVFLKFVVK